MIEYMWSVENVCISSTVATCFKQQPSYEELPDILFCANLYKHCTKRNYPPKVDRVTLKRYVMWYIALHILLDNLFLHILTPNLP